MPVTRSKLVRWAVLLAAILLPPARGGAEPGQRRERAQALAEAGTAALAAGDLDKALTTLEQAYRTAPLVDLLYQLGRVAQAQGRSVPAADLYGRYQESSLEQEGAANRDAISRFFRELKAETTSLFVTADAGALLAVDGRVAGALPLSGPLLVSPGQHRFRLEVGSRSYESDPLEVPAHRPAELRLSPGAGHTAIAVLSLPPVVAVLVSPLGLPSGAADTLMRVLSESVQKQHSLVVPREKVRAALPQPAAVCAGAPECLLSLGERAGAALVLALRLGADGQGGYRLHGQMIDIGVGEQAAAKDAACSGCDVAGAVEPANSLAAQLLLESLSRRRGTLEVQSTPPGANVRIDGRLRGVTPLSLPSYVADHRVHVERDGFVPVSAVLPVEVGQTASLSVKLTPELPGTRRR